MSQRQKQCSRILHCCPSSRCGPWFSWDINTEIFPEGTWDKIFDTEIVAALGRALGGSDSSASSSAVEIFTAALGQGALLCFHGIHIVTEIFPEGIRDKIFDTEIIAALRRALGHSDSSTRQHAVKFFTAAVAQSVILCFHAILSLKYSQRGFGTRYLTPRSSPYLDVH